MGGVSFLGLSSGTDWNSVINQLVQVERRPLEKFIQNRDRLQFRQSVMGRVNTQLGKLNTQLSNLRFESTFLSRTATSSSPSKVNASADAGAAVGTYSVEVSRLAQAARAVSGLEGELYSKVANVSPTQTLGVGGLTPYGEFQATRALATTLIKDTLQAGRGGAGITAGDSISISGQLKDGTAVSGTFVFSGGSNDTLQRLATTVAQVFHGQIAGSVGSNGELVFIETDPSVAGDVSFSMSLPPIGMKFNDNDFSGSTLRLDYGNNLPGAGATARRLVSDTTFTTAGALQPNDTTDLALLDQVTSGALNPGDQIKITGIEQGGSAIAPVFFTYTGAAGGQTIADLVNEISAAFVTANATYENGKIVLTGTATGASSLQVDLDFVDNGAATTFSTGSFSVGETGRSAVAQMVTSSSFTVEGSGEHLLSGSNGLAGRVRGNTTLLDPSNTLSSYGVTEFDLLTIDVDSAAGSLGPRTITGISEYSSIQDLLDAINEQVPAVTAQLVAVGATYRLEIVGNDGGRNVRMYDAAGGILDKVFKPGTTDIDSSTNDGVNSFGATSSTTDFTIVDWFTPTNGGPAQRRVATGSDGFPVVDLIGGVAINAAGGGFDSGVATIVTANSAELNTRQEMSTYLFGSADIAASPPQGIPFIDPSRPLADAGFAIQPKNISENPLFHTDGFFTINGVRINVGDVHTTSLNHLLGAINTSGAGVTASFDTAGHRMVLRSNKAGPQSIVLGGGGDSSNFLQIAGLLASAGGVLVNGQLKGGIDTKLPLAQSGFTQAITSGVFTINGAKISFDAGVDSLEDLFRKIGNSGAGVTASYDIVTDRLSLAQKLDGSSHLVQIQLGDPSDTSNFLEAANLTSDTNQTQNVGSTRQTSLFSVNGVSYERSSNEVSDVIDKVKLSLSSVTAGPETITISGDTQRGEDALVDFITEYNSTMELINAKPLTREERRYTAELTNDQANALTVEEINQYLTRRQELLTRDFVTSDNGLRQLTRQIQNLVTGLVRNSGSFQSLSQLGLATGQIGSGAEGASTSLGRLVAPTSDKETIRQFIKSNSDLRDALTSKSQDLYELFSAALESRYTHTGSFSLAGGLSVAAQLRFTIGDGTKSAAVTFNTGTYSQTAVLNRINGAINSAQMGSSVLAFYDALNQLNIRSASGTSQARLSLLDQSTGADSLLGATGLEPGIFFGPDPNVSGGVARRTREIVQNATRIGGYVFEQVKENGGFDRQINTYNKRITEMERNLSTYEQRMRTKFARLETALSRMQSESAQLQAALAKLNAQSSQST